MAWRILTNKGFFKTSCLGVNLFTDKVEEAFCYKTKKEIEKDFKYMKRDNLNPKIIYDKDKE